MNLLKVKCWATLAEVDPNGKYVDKVRQVSIMSKMIIM